MRHQAARPNRDGLPNCLGVHVPAHMQIVCKIGDIIFSHRKTPHKTWPKWHKMEMSPQSTNMSRSPLDWGLFTLVTIMWAGAYALTRVAVDKGDPSSGLPVIYVLSGRLTLGAIALLVMMVAMKQRLPSLKNRKAWLFICLMGCVGSVAPFYLITTAQQTVNSSLAALYTSAAPIFIALGANLFFADERLTKWSGLGVILGFAGVVVLFGPTAIVGKGSGALIAQILLLIATLFYSASTLLARGAPRIDPIAFAAGFVSVGAVLSWPLAIMTEPEGLTVSAKHWAAVIALGLGPTAIAQGLYMIIIQRSGATFLSLTGYTIPIASAIIGWIAFRETQSWNALLAFVMILGGVWLARRPANRSDR